MGRCGRPKDRDPWSWPHTAKVKAQSLRKSPAVLNSHTYPLVSTTVLRANLSQREDLIVGSLGCCTEGLPSTYYWIQQLRYRYSLSVVGGQGDGWGFERKRTHIFLDNLRQIQQEGFCRRECFILTQILQLQCFLCGGFQRKEQASLDFGMKTDDGNNNMHLVHLTFTGPKFKLAY